MARNGVAGKRETQRGKFRGVGQWGVAIFGRRGAGKQPKKNTKIAPPPPHPPHRNRPKKNNENKDEMNEQMFYRVLPSFSSLSGMKVTPRVLTGAANELICIMKLLDQLLMGLFPLAAHLHNERLRGVETVFIGGSFAYAMMAPFIECRPAFYRMLCK